MSERPWWLPTAVVAAPVCVAVAGLALWAEARTGALTWPLTALVVTGAAIAPFIHLGRREDRWRDRLRPSHLNRWGFERVIHPWRALGVEIAGWASIFGAFGAAAVVLEVTQSSARLPLAITLGGIGLIALLAWAVSGMRRKGWPARPEWQTAFLWRWPVTASLGIALFTGSVLAGAGWVVAHGQWMTVAPAVFFVQPFLRALIRLLNPVHPDRHYGRKVTA